MIESTRSYVVQLVCTSRRGLIFSFRQRAPTLSLDLSPPNDGGPADSHLTP
ncbi:Bromo domain-containing protein [Psidium guajava]|nr:Bromo domain-containing protein [Psidium guajava]